MNDSISDRLAAAGLPPLPRGAWLEIDVAALANNVAVFRELIGPGVELNAVVKADGYGHGLKPVARVFEEAGVDRLCVASLDEALALRVAGIESPILVLFPIPPDGIGDAASNNIQITVSDPSVFAASRTAAADELVNIEIEVETGLTRGGVRVDGLPAVLQQVRTSKLGLGVAGIWTHVATPEDEAATAAQVNAFERALHLAREAGEFVPAPHMAATGGLLTGRVPTYKGVRIGLGLYGLRPLDLPMSAQGAAAADRLKSAMALKCRPLRVERFAIGIAVSYGGRWTTERDSVIATLPVGYADAIPRPAPWGQALVRGRRVPLVGTVAMDAVMADVTDVPGVSVEDEFVLLGRQGDDEITAEELARARNTIPWEVATSHSYRLPRVYHAASVLMGLRTLSADTSVTTTAASIKGDRT